MNPDTLVTIVIGIFMFVVFIAGFFRRYTTGAASILVSAGIFGTFVGISLALRNFDTTNIQGSVPALLDGMKTAFETSVIGILLALILRTIHMIRSSTTGTSSSANTPEKLEPLLNRQLDVLHQMRAAIAGDGEGSLLNQLKLTRTESADQARQLLKENREHAARMEHSFEEFAQTLAENNSKALIEALSNIIHDFNANLTEQFGENFKELNRAVERLVEWQDRYTTVIDHSTKLFDQSSQNLETISQSMLAIENRAQSLVTASERLAELLQAMEQSEKDLERKLQAFASLSSTAQEAFPVIEKNLAQLTEGFAESVENSTRRAAEIVEYQRKSADTASTSLQDAVEDLRTGLTAVLERLEKTADTNLSTLASSFAASVQAASETASQIVDQQRQSAEISTATLNEGVEDLRTGLIAVLERLEKTADSHLSTLADSFAASVQSATEKASQIVDQQRQAAALSTANLHGAVENLRTGSIAVFERLENSLDTNLSTLADSFATSVKTASETASQIVDQQRRSAEISTATLNEAIEDLRTGLTAVLERLEKTADTNLSTLASSFAASVQAATEKASQIVVQQEAAAEASAEKLNDGVQKLHAGMNESLKRLDEALAAELTKSLESLGRQLATLSGKFAEDYSPLTEKLQRVVRIAERIPA